MKVRVVFILCLFVGGTGCQRKLTELGTSPKSAKVDVVADKVDSTINPADDFFDWANGGWFKAYPMPPSESHWGIEALVYEEIFQNTINVCRNASVKQSPQGTIEQKIGDLWSTGMDTAKIEVQGLDPIRPTLERISSIKNFEEFFEVTGELYAVNTNPLFYSYVYQDKMQSNRYSFYISQGGLGLFEKDYYLIDDERNMKVRWEYVHYIKRALISMGESERTAFLHATCILKIETFLARKHSVIDDMSNPRETYNKLSISDLEKQTPSVLWHKMFKSMGFPADSVIIEQLDFIKQLDLGMQTFTLEEWKTYLKFWFVNTISAYLPQRFGMNQFQFYGGLLEGRKQIKPRWKFLLEDEERLLGEGIGRLFVKDFFSEKTKKRYSDMVEKVRDAFIEDINDLTWMSESTKIEALKKLNKMKKKVGYPDHWRDFNDMKIDRQSYVNNIISGNRWWFLKELTKLTRDVDRNEWNITPQEYNAYYSPANNEIVVSASVVSIPGFSDNQIDDAVAYGYVAGSTIGHEVTHGFDMEGKEYDMNGNLRKWWTPEDSLSFVQRAYPLIEQYNQYVVVDTFRCKGEATWNENIADLGGVTLALRAFKKTDQYKKGKKIAGYTPLQRFFMGYALGWMNIYTKERLIRKVTGDEHAPPKWRINGVLSNIPEFYEAFNVKPQNKMWIQPSKRVKIW